MKPTGYLKRAEAFPIIIVLLAHLMSKSECPVKLNGQFKTVFTMIGGYHDLSVYARKCARFYESQ